MAAEYSLRRKHLRPVSLPEDTFTTWIEHACFLRKSTLDATTTEDPVAWQKYMLRVDASAYHIMRGMCVDR